MCVCVFLWGGGGGASMHIKHTSLVNEKQIRHVYTTQFTDTKKKNTNADKKKIDGQTKKHKCIRTKNHIHTKEKTPTHKNNNSMSTEKNGMHTKQNMAYR